jgi:hypothetical protein
LGRRLPKIHRVHLPKSLAPTPAPSVEVGGTSLEAELLKLLDGGVDSPVAIAVGTSEGTRTPDGRFTSAWYGHTDPGNGKRNQGSFSYQHSTESPKAADMQQLKKIRDVLLPKFLKPVQAVNLPTSGLKQLFLVACDLYTQSEIACIGRGGFLQQLRGIPPYQIATDTIIDWRVAAYHDPETGQLDAPGFGNNLERLRADQQRRTEAVLWAAETLGLLKWEDV